MDQSFTHLKPDQNLLQLQVTQSDLFFYQNDKKIRKVYQNCQYDQYQKQQIAQFRTFCEGKQDLTNIQDFTILRYLYSLSFNHADALSKLKLYIQWYKNPKISQIDDIAIQLINQGFIYTFGRDKKHRPMIYLNTTKINLQKYTIDNYLCASNAIISLVIQRLFVKGKIQNYCFVMDTQGQSLNQLPLKSVKQMSVLFSYVFAMRMGKMLALNCNYWAKLLYSAVSPFLSDITKQKVNLLSIQEVKNGKMKQYADPDQLQKKYGGDQQNLTVKWPPQLPKRPKKHHHHHLHHSHTIQDNYEIQSEYFSCENNSLDFYMVEQRGIISNEGCCQSQQCVIY